MKKPMLSAFSVGSPTALILDSGHTQSRATVVQDGFCLDSEYVPYGGGTINSILQQKIEQEVGHSLGVPHLVDP